MKYNPKIYWDKRLSQKFDLQGVGYYIFNRFYNFWLYKAKSRVLKSVIKKYNIKVCDKYILDIGCGTGYWIDFYKNLTCNITGIDISKTSVKNLRQKYLQFEFINVDFASENATKLINKKYDIINAFDVFYHIVDDYSFQQALINIHQLLNDNAYILISDILVKKSIRTADHVKFRNIEEYDRVFSKLNIKIISVEPIYCLLNKLIFGALNINRFSNIGIKMDELLSPLYYFLDYILIKICKGNLNLLVAKK